MLLSSVYQANIRAGAVRRFASGKFSTRGWMRLVASLRLKARALKVSPNTRPALVRRAACLLSEVAVAAASR
jgi:hypothetical protein